jgi:hypothetical protein
MARKSNTNSIKSEAGYELAALGNTHKAAMQQEKNRTNASQEEQVINARKAKDLALAKAKKKKKAKMAKASKKKNKKK